MLDIKEIRELIGDKAKDMTDKRIIEVRDSLYGLAEIAVEDCFKNFKSRELKSK